MATQLPARDGQPDARAALERYQLHGVRETGMELGRGSYAAVIEVDYKGMRCAAKKIYDILTAPGEGDRLVARFEEECHLLGKLRHPHIVQFLGIYFDAATDLPVLVMEFLPATLAQCVDRYGRPPAEISYAILRDVALGLRHLHEQRPRLIHRDLSANNVLLTGDMAAKISDLGVAKILRISPAEMSRMTQTPGTQSYMPPEALRPNPRYDVAVDVFSFGVMLVHVLCGQWPFPSEATRVDSGNPAHIIGLSEVERRARYLDIIGRPSDEQEGHPIMPLIECCLSNSPNLRPNASDLVEQMSTASAEHPLSFSNRIDMMQRITSIQTEKEALQTQVSDLERQAERGKQAWTEQREENERCRATLSLEVEQLRLQVADLEAEKTHLSVTESTREELLQIQLREREEAHLIERQAKDRFKAEKQQLQAQLQEKDQQFQAQLQEKDQQLQAQLQEKDQQLQAQLQEKDQQLLAQVQEKDQQLQAQLQDKDQQFQVQLQEKDQQLLAQVQEKDQQFQAQLQEKDQQFQEQLQEKDQQLLAQLQEKDQQLLAQLQEKDQQLQEKDEQLQTQLQEKDQQLQAQLQEKDQQLLAQVQEKDQQFQAQLQEKDQQLQVQLQEKDQQLLAQVQEKDQQFQAQLQEKDQQFQAQLQEKDQQLQAQLQEKDQQFQAQLQEKDRQLKENDRQLQAQLQEKDRQLQGKDRQLKEKDRQLQAQLVEKDQQLQALLGEKDRLYSSQLSNHEAQLQAQDAELLSQSSLLSRHRSTIEGLHTQMQQAREHLAMGVQVHAFSPNAKLVWRECAPMLEMMALAQVTVIKGMVYIGGSLNQHAMVLKYDPMKNAWSTLPPPPVELVGVGQLNGKLVLVGGEYTVEEGEEEATGDVHVFEEEAQQWVKSIPPMPSRLLLTTVVCHSSCLVVCGGTSPPDGSPSAAVSVYSSQSSQWHSAQPLPFSATLCSAVVVNDTCYVAEGFCSITSLNDVACSSSQSVASAPLSTLLDPNASQQASTWQCMPDTPFYNSPLAATGGCLLAVGGYSKSSTAEEVLQNLTTAVHAYCPSTSSWVKIGDMTDPQFLITITTVPSGELFVAGGIPKSSTDDEDNHKKVFMGIIN